MRQIKYPEELDFSVLPIPREYRNSIARPNASIETDDIVFSLQSIERKIGVNGSTDSFSLDYRVTSIEGWKDNLKFTDITDAPSSYSGYGGKFVAVKDDCSGLEFVTGAGGVTSFTDLDDVTATYAGAGGYFVKVNAGATALEFVAGGAGASTFLDLTDTPANYTGSSLFVVRVNVGETALEFVDYLNQAVKSTSSPTFAGLTLTGFTENLLMTNASGVVGAPANMSYSDSSTKSDSPTWLDVMCGWTYDLTHGKLNLDSWYYYKIYAYRTVSGVKYFSALGNIKSIYTGD